MRRYTPRVLFVVVVVAQLTLLGVAFGDVHKRFGFQPFNEADSWRAVITHTVDGDGRAVSDAEWNALVGHDRLTNPGRDRHATSGAASTFDYLDRSLDWLADTEGGEWRADVTWFHNGDGPRTAVFESGADER